MVQRIGQNYDSEGAPGVGARGETSQRRSRKTAGPVLAHPVFLMLHPNPDLTGNGRNSVSFPRAKQSHHFLSP